MEVWEFIIQQRFTMRTMKCKFSVIGDLFSEFY